MSLRNISQVSCLLCNLKVEIGCSKNIFKTAFAQTRESLAPFVSTTLSLPGTSLPSSHLCLKCLNLFGKLEEALRRVKSIKCEIHKAFQDNHRSEVNIISKIQNAKKDSSVKPQVPIIKKKAVITQCTLSKSAKIFIKKKPTTINSVIHSTLETKNTSTIQIKNNCSGVKLVKLEPSKQSLKNNNISNQSTEKIGKLKNDYISIDNDVVNSLPSLNDHQYSCRKLVNISDILSALQRKKAINIENKNLESKKPKLPKPDSYTCSNCGMKTNTMKELKQHKKIHMDLYPYMCDKCGKLYKSSKALKYHVDMHNGITPYICTECNKCFTQKCALKRHMAVHTGETAYECNICSKKFIHQSSYKIHILSHTKEKVHKCNLCTLSFMSTSHLKRHMRTHGGEKRHSCKICGKSFFERYNVVAHLKTHDPEQNRLKEAKMKQKRVIQRRCEKCQIDFATMAEYNVHLHSHTAYDGNTFVNGIHLPNLSISNECQSMSTS